MSDDLEASIDGLYRLPLAEFVTTRNSLAAELRGAGRRDDATRVKALPRPTPPAWAVNQVHHEHPELLAELRGAGGRLRLAQRSGDPAAFADASRARGSALAACERAARELLLAAGLAAPQATLRAISRTLEAVAAGGDADLDPPVGRLTRELSPPGFDALGDDAFVADVAPRAAVAPALQPSESERREEARSLLDRARRELADAEPAQAAARARAEDAERAAAELRRALDAAEAALRAARAEAVRSSTRVDAAREQVADAERLVRLLE